jgi:Sulfatase
MIGSIEVGKQADLVVLGKSLFDVRPEQIHDVPVLLTLMDGKAHHDAAIPSSRKLALAGAETLTFPDGGITPFKGQKGESWEGGYRAPMVIRWPGHIKPGQVTNQIMAALDWVPTLVEIAGGPNGDGLKKEIEAGKYPGIVKTTLDGVNQADFISGKTETSARDFLFYYSGAQLAAVRCKNWKFTYYGSQPGYSGWLLPLVPYHFNC